MRGTDGVTVPGSGLENKFLHFTSAGNIKTLSPSNPASNSPFAAARMMPGLSAVIPHLTNTRVIENAIGLGAAGVQCLNENSKRPGDLSAIGTDVFSLAGPRSGVDTFSGTSFATPQAAGLAAYLWALDSTPTPQQLATLLRATSESSSVSVGFDSRCSSTAVQSATIDAYRAVLSLDTPSLPTPSSAPIRFAIVDSDGDDDFDGDDLDDFAFVYLDNGVPVAPTDRDYSRWDLNGDGFTGGARRAAHDLDRVGSTLYGVSQLASVSQSIEGRNATFDETAVTDLDILCYYAYSALYTGTSTARATILAPHCEPGVCEAPAAAVAGPGVRVDDVVHTGDLRIQTQVEVDAFAAAGITQVTGNLTIGGSTAAPSTLTSLTGLSTLADVGGAVSISNNASLTALAGLDGLASIGGSLTIASNASLASLEALEGLSAIGAAFAGSQLNIASNPVLETLTGLESVRPTQPVSLVLSLNPQLRHLDALTGMSSEVRNVFLTSNGGLTNVDGLCGMTNAGSLSVIDNAVLTSLDGLGGVTHVDFGLTIRRNDALTALDGLDRLTRVGGTLDVAGESLTSVAGLGALERVGGLNVFNDAVSFASMTSYQLPALTRVDGDLHVTGGAGSLTSVRLPSLARIEDPAGSRLGTVTLSRPGGLAVQLPTLVFVSDDLRIFSNAGGSTSLTLGPSAKIGRDVMITDNVGGSLSFGTIGTVGRDILVMRNRNIALSLRVNTTERDVNIGGVAFLGSPSNGNQNVSLGGLSFGSALRDVNVIDNRGFTDEAATAWAGGISVGRLRTVFGNQL